MPQEKVRKVKYKAMFARTIGTMFCVRQTRDRLSIGIILVDEKTKCCPLKDKDNLQTLTIETRPAICMMFTLHECPGELPIFKKLHAIPERSYGLTKEIISDPKYGVILSYLKAIQMVLEVTSLPIK